MNPLCLSIPLLVVASMLSACGGPATYGNTPVAGPATRAATPAKTRKMIPTQRGGGYYKDDGPGDEIPDDLDDIPDAVPRLEPLHRFANRPYVVLGKSYVPDTSLRPFRQRGVASWYGKKFHGQKTSIGEPYDMFSMTAAHPTMAIPSYARITNLSNGKTVVVRVVDRGPFHADRVIDLSYAAAYRLGYINTGSTQVEVESIVPGEDTALAFAPTRAAPAPAATRDEMDTLVARLAAEPAERPVSQPAARPAGGSGLYLQLGAFSNADNAESLRAHLSRELDWLSEGIEINAAGGMHRVHLGPYASRAEAEKVAERIQAALGYKPAFVNRTAQKSQ